VNKNYPFPSKWLYADLKTIAKINPKFDRTKYSDELGVSFIPMKRVSELTGDVDLSETRKFGKVKKGYTPFQDGDIIFAKITPCMENGKVAILSRLSNGIGFGSTEFHVLRLPKFMPRKYLFYYLIQEGFRKNAKRNMTGSVGQKRVPTDYLKQIEIPFPPLPEQHRIVTKIEELFTKLDAGVEALKQAQAQLKRYRQSVLKSAMEGRLTAEWREMHINELEPAGILLERTQEEWKEKLGKKFKKKTAVDTTDLPELPEGWIWCNIEQLAQAKKNAIKAGPFGSSLKKTYYTSKGYKIYGQEQVLRGDASYGDYYIDQKRYQLLKSCDVVPGDILISLVGTIGEVLILPNNIEPGIINPRLVKLSLDDRVIRPSYFRFYLQSPSTKSYFKLVSHGGTMDILNLTILKKLPIPLPPIKEQKVVRDEIDHHLSIADKVESILELELKCAQSLRKSILKQAFEGKLVPQDPNDEPASALLERIKAKKVEQKKSLQMEMF